MALLIPLSGGGIKAEHSEAVNGVGQKGYLIEYKLPDLRSPSVVVVGKAKKLIAKSIIFTN